MKMGGVGKRVKTKGDGGLAGWLGYSNAVCIVLLVMILAGALPGGQ
jgi:hypothetical protein